MRISDQSHENVQYIYSFFERRDDHLVCDKAKSPPSLSSKLKPNVDSIDTVYIVDEASMLSDSYSIRGVDSFGSGYLLRDFLDYISLNKNAGRKIIFMGDDAQLPPVFSKFSPALSKDYLAERYNYDCSSFLLKDIVRQKLGSGIMANATNLRKAQETLLFRGFDYLFNDVTGLSGVETINKYIEICEGDIGKTSESIVLAQTNNLVQIYNNVIRKRLLGVKKNKLVKREKIICTSNFYYDNNFISNGEFGRVIRISDDIELKRVIFQDRNNKDTTKPISVDLHFVDAEIEFEDDNGIPYILKTKVLLNLLDVKSKEEGALLNNALYWEFFFRVPRKLRTKSKLTLLRADDPYFNVLKIRYGYAITVHKAQGSEWCHVFVDSKFCGGKDIGYYRWLYTAITRAKTNLYIREPKTIGFQR